MEADRPEGGHHSSRGTAEGGRCQVAGGQMQEGVRLAGEGGTSKGTSRGGTDPLVGEHRSRGEEGSMRQGHRQGGEHLKGEMDLMLLPGFLERTSYET
jgi:hypothetical protein